MSSTPSRTIRTIVSGDVNRPTPTTGLVVNCFRPLTYCSWSASSANRDVFESKSQSPTMKSHRSGSSPTSARASEISSRWIPSLADQLVDADAAGDRGSAVDLLQRVLEHLAQQPHAVRDRPAVLVIAVV